MAYERKSNYELALDDFHRARRQAATSEILRKLRGQPASLLPFEEVRQHIKPQESHERGLHYIPLDAIVGSVGRYADFTRDFLPRSRSLQARWARLKSIFRNLADMPPIQVFQIGEVYFVLDGNHRVSIAKERGATEIRAYVTEVNSPVEITPETDLDSFILETAYTSFMERMQFDKLHPGVDLTVTSPGGYQLIERQIEQVQVQQGGSGNMISLPEAAQIWYQNYYLPIQVIIQTRAMLWDFPGRTETDLYVWIFKHKQELQKSLGWKIGPESAAINLADQFSARPVRIFARIVERIRQSIIPTSIMTGPKPGKWREQQLALKSRKRLFENILVTVSGETQNWQALQQALIFAKREGANLLGLHVVPKKKLDDAPKAQFIRKEFMRVCQEAGISGELAIEVGEITPTINDRAQWSDLVVVHLAHPPSQDALKHLAPGFHRLVQRCPRPMLAVPRYRPALNKMLLAYDGSPKADEALFVAAYLTEKWELPLTMLVVLDGEAFPKKAIARARWYMSTHKILGDIHIRYGTVAETILQTAENAEFDLIIMGGYSHSPVIELVIGSAVNNVLRASKIPILICR